MLTTRMMRAAYKCRPSLALSRTMSDLPAFRDKSGFQYTQPPAPKWQFGDGLRTDSELGARWKEDEQKGFKIFDPAKEEPRTIYKLMTSGITPRPIAFVSSQDKEGKSNLAPFSYFGICSHSPPMVSVSVNCNGNLPKDTAKCIMEAREFTVNIISEAFVEAANWTSVDAPYEVDEWVGSGLTRVPSTLVKPPRVLESAFSMECELYQSIPLASPSTPDKPGSYMLIGLVKLFHVRNAVLGDAGNTVDPHKLAPVARMGDITYSTLGDGFRIPRPQWDDVKAEYEKQTS